MSSFPERLKEAMEDRNMTITRLSNASKISKPLLSNYLKGNYKAKQENLYILSNILNVSPTWLMGFDVDKDREWFGGNNIDDETYETYKNSKPLDEVEILYSKTKDFLTDDDREMIMYVMEKTKRKIDEQLNNK